MSDLDELAQAAQTYSPYRVIARRRAAPQAPLIYVGGSQRGHHPFSSGFFGTLGVLAAIVVVAIVLRYVFATPEPAKVPVLPPAIQLKDVPNESSASNIFGIGHVSPQPAPSVMRLSAEWIDANHVRVFGTNNAGRVFRDGRFELYEHGSRGLRPATFCTFTCAEIQPGATVDSVLDVADSQDVRRGSVINVRTRAGAFE